MGNKQKTCLTAVTAELRIQAEERLQTKSNEKLQPRTDDTRRTLDQQLELHQIELEMQNLEMHRVQEELETQQIELEMQNEELRQIQEELELSRNKFVELYDFAPVGYFTFNASGTMQEVNINGSQLLGTERQQLTNAPFDRFIPDPAERDIFSDHLKLVLQQKEIQKCDVKLLKTDGTLIYCQFRSIAINLDNKPGYILTSIVDNTIRKMLENEIQDAREYAENIVETVHKPLVVLNSDLKILTANHSFYETFSVTPEETIGNFIYDLGNRQWDIPKLRVLFENILPNDSVFNGYEVEHDFLDIGHKTILLNARQIFREKIGSHIILLAMEDITERKLMETEIQDAREYAENIVETVREPLVVLNSDLKVLTANHSFYETFKVTPEATIGNFIYDLGNRQWDIPKLRILVEEILPLDTVINGYEVEHNFPGIGHKIIMLNARQIFREKIGSRIILLAMEDITERKQMGEELQDAHDKLEVVVLERTSELTKANMQLTQEIQERKKAEESLRGTYAEIKQLKDRLQAENIFLQQEVAKQYNFGEVVGQSSVLTHVFSQVEQVAPMNATVLLLGETGTGKGIIARAIHSSSSRKGRPLLTVDCTTLPASLVESELFGRERGAYTGSDARQIGRFELADGGTIFLDEIGEMPLELQCKLLRVIQDGEFERLGSPRTIKTDVRIIAATNRNLTEEVKNGKFREDLFYRLNVFPITMPPLRLRKDDIPLLVNHFVAKFNSKIGKKIATVSTGTLNALQEYHWPGNVRELESVIERAVIISQGNSLQVLDRFDTLPKSEEQPNGQDVKAMAELEHDHVLQVLQKTGWRIEGKNGAALLLGLNPSTLRARMRKYGISRQ